MSRRLIRSVSFLTILFLIGIVFYMRFENLDFVNAFYISGSSLTTLGVGHFELSPIGKLFTIIYSIIGLGTIFYISCNFVTFLSTKEFHMIEVHKKKKKKKKKRKKKNQ